MSGKYLLWSFLFSWPIVHFCGLVINTCKGDKGPNQYGPDPLDPQSQKINPQPITEGITKVTIIEDKQTEEIIDVEL